MCLSVFPQKNLQKLMQLGSSNLTQKCSTTSTGNPFISGSKGQSSSSGGHRRTFPVWVFALL